jgi:hypothetical protein
VLLKSFRARAAAGVAELVDAPDLGSGGAICGGSTPSARTTSSLQPNQIDEIQLKLLKFIGFSLILASFYVDTQVALL